MSPTSVECGQAWHQEGEGTTGPQKIIIGTPLETGQWSGTLAKVSQGAKIVFLMYFKRAALHGWLSHRRGRRFSFKRIVTAVRGVVDHYVPTTGWGVGAIGRSAVDRSEYSSAVVQLFVEGEELFKVRRTLCLVPRVNRGGSCSSALNKGIAEARLVTIGCQLHNFIWFFHGSSQSVYVGNFSWAHFLCRFRYNVVRSWRIEVVATVITGVLTLGTLLG